MLTKFNAVHGNNEFKDEMHIINVTKPLEYWTKRPIDKTLLLYSAYDVEDLPEVFFTIRG